MLLTKNPIPIIIEAERMCEKPSQISAIAPIVLVRATIINVLRPAECRFVDLSHPIIPESIKESSSLSTADPAVKDTLHSPRREAIGSLILFLLFYIIWHI